jgi:hypothetical protein
MLFGILWTNGRNGLVLPNRGDDTLRVTEPQGALVAYLPNAGY